MAVLVLRAQVVLPIRQALLETRETMALRAARERQALWEIPVVQVTREPLVRMATQALLVLLVVGPLQVTRVTPVALVQMAIREQRVPQVQVLRPVLRGIPEVRHRQPTQTRPL